MTFKIDYRDGDVFRWSVTPEGATYTRDGDYTPTVFVSTTAQTSIAEVERQLTTQPMVVDTEIEEWRTVWRNDQEPVVRVDVRTIDAVTDLAHEVRSWGGPGEYRLYNVDLAREFRYCLENDVTPVPAARTDQAGQRTNTADRNDSEGDDASESPGEETVGLTSIQLQLNPKARNDGDLSALMIDGEPVGGSDVDAIEAIEAMLAARDPDVLVVSASDLIPLCYRTALSHDHTSFELGRLPGFQQLAHASTFESYGRVGHSPARYNVPGRAIIDVSNSFFWRQTNLSGLLDLVERSGKPLQETAWASIGNVLTSIQIRVAIDRGVLVPWNSWRHEQFKSMATLDEADRGGVIFSPVVGLHEDVHELDFSSLYPNIMVTRNVSPDTIRCACHADREDVPGLGYSICDDPGYIRDVLKPIIDDRDRYKRLIEADSKTSSIEELQGRSSALKWILVSCFGYQGFSNAKFGRIECHEAINAFAREILMDAKAALEQHGWEVIHGIVDSLWVKARSNADQTPLETVAQEVTDEVGIALEYETAYDWIAFAPRRESEAGALNRYFGKITGEDTFKKRGIELRQRSTPAFIDACQQEWLEALDEYRAPEPVCDRLQVHLARLRSGTIDPDSLLIRRRVSKTAEEYSQYTRHVAALERADSQAFEVAPGEDVRYVVVDDTKQSAARVRLAHEDLDQYDVEFYADLLVRAAESVLLPLGWDQARIRRYLAETAETAITAY